MMFDPYMQRISVMSFYCLPTVDVAAKRPVGGIEDPLAHRSWATFHFVRNRFAWTIFDPVIYRFFLLPSFGCLPTFEF